MGCLTYMSKFKLWHLVDISTCTCLVKKIPHTFCKKILCSNSRHPINQCTVSYNYEYAYPNFQTILKLRAKISLKISDPNYFMNKQ